MRSFLCKVFKFLLDIVSQIADLVANTIITIATAAVDVLSEVASSVSGAFLKNPLVIGLFAIGILWFLGGEEDDKRKST